MNILENARTLIKHPVSPERMNKWVTLYQKNRLPELHGSEQTSVPFQQIYTNEGLIPAMKYFVDAHTRVGNPDAPASAKALASLIGSAVLAVSQSYKESERTSPAAKAVDALMPVTAGLLFWSHDDPPNDTPNWRAYQEVQEEADKARELAVAAYKEWQLNNEYVEGGGSPYTAGMKSWYRDSHNMGEVGRLTKEYERLQALAEKYRQIAEEADQMSAEFDEDGKIHVVKK